MQMNWKTMITGVAAAAIVALAGAAVGAREQGPGPGGPGGMMGRRGPGGPGGPGGPMAGILPELRGLGLSDTQREQVRAVFESHKTEMEGIGTRMRTARQALNAAVTADTFDEGAIRAKSADVAVVEADGAVLRAKVRGEVWALLTPEQQQKARDLQARVEQRVGQMRDRMQLRRQQRQQKRQQAEH